MHTSSGPDSPFVDSYTRMEEWRKPGWHVATCIWKVQGQHIHKQQIVKSGLGGAETGEESRMGEKLTFSLS